MGGIFGTISKKSCVANLFYGTDYNSHLGTRRGGLATYSSEKGFVRDVYKRQTLIMSLLLTRAVSDMLLQSVFRLRSWRIRHFSFRYS